MTAGNEATAAVMAAKTVPAAAPTAPPTANTSVTIFCSAVNNNVVTPESAVETLEVAVMARVGKLPTNGPTTPSISAIALLTVVNSGFSTI